MTELEACQERILKIATERDRLQADNAELVAICKRWIAGFENRNDWEKGRQEMLAGIAKHEEMKP